MLHGPPKHNGRYRLHSFVGCLSCRTNWLIDHAAQHVSRCSWIHSLLHGMAQWLTICGSLFNQETVPHLCSLTKILDANPPRLFSRLPGDFEAVVAGHARLHDFTTTAILHGNLETHPKKGVVPAISRVPSCFQGENMSYPMNCDRQRDHSHWSEFFTGWVCPISKNGL